MTAKEFKRLNYNNEILHIGNVWDLQSALMMEKSGYKVLGTSSLAIANSFGYEDGEEISFEVLYQISKQIISKVKIPLSVDIEGGYTRDTQKIVENIVSLHNIGVVGINIEDSILKDGKREILSKDEFSKKLREIKSSLEKKNIDIFINVRTDNFIMGLDNPLEDTLQRIKSYEQNGADGIFVPCIVDIEDIKKVVSASTLPINVMTMPTLDDFNTLQNAGVKRVSQGPFIYNNQMKYFEDRLETINNDRSFKSLFS